MTAEEPALRPSAADALREWQTLYQRASSFKRLWRVGQANEALHARVFRYMFYPVSGRSKRFICIVLTLIDVSSSFMYLM